MIGEFIRNKRVELKLSLAELAQLLRKHGYAVERQTIGHWEVGRNNAPIASAQFRQALAAAFQMDLNDLIAELNLGVRDSERSPEALYVADVIDRLPEDGRELMVEYAHMMETRYLKKIEMTN